MKLVKFAFTKIKAEKKKKIMGKMNITNNVIITGVDNDKGVTAPKGEYAIQFKFQFTSEYEPGFASVVFDGEITLLDEEKKSKKAIDSWKKNKKLPKEVIEPVLNAILTRCNIQALIMSKDLNLPPSVPLPRLSVEKKDNSYIG